MLTAAMAAMTSGWTPAQLSDASARHGLAGVALDSRFYVIAGGPTAGLSVAGTTEVFTP